MRPDLQLVSSVQFNDSSATLLFGTPNSNCFGIIDCGSHVFKLAWDSEHVHPEIFFDGKEICGVGIDLSYAIFNVKSGVVVKRFEFDTYFARAIGVDDSLFIFCETEAIRLHTSDWKIIGEYGFPDVFESVDGEEERLVVNCMDGREVVIEL